MFDEFREPLRGAALEADGAGRRLGRKSGQGFYAYKKW